MIRSESEYRETVLRSQKGTDRLVQYRKELQANGLSSEEIETVIGPMVSLNDDLIEEIERYNRFKDGDLSGIKALRDIGLLLIAARIASGLSQRDLSQRLDIHESQVSRDEKNEYQGITFERAALILEALSVDVQIHSRVQRIVAETAPTNAMGAAKRSKGDILIS